MKNTELTDLLKKRDLTIESLARLAFCGPKSVVQILRGQRVGTPTWNKLKRVMTAEELLCAMRFANVRLCAEANCRLELLKERIVAVTIDPNLPKAPVKIPQPLAACST